MFLLDVLSKKGDQSLLGSLSDNFCGLRFLKVWDRHNYGNVIWYGENYAIS